MADETKLTAATRLEKLLDNIAGGENEVTPATRLEKFLSYIADAVEGGGGSGDLPVRELSVSVDDSIQNATVYAYLNGNWREVFQGNAFIFNVSGLESGNALIVYQDPVTGYKHLATSWEEPFSYAGAEGVAIGESEGYYLVGSGVVFIEHGFQDLLFTTLTENQITHVEGTIG